MKGSFGRGGGHIFKMVSICMIQLHVLLLASLSTSRCSAFRPLAPTNFRPRDVNPIQVLLSSSNDNNGNNYDEGIGVGIDLGTTHSAIAILDPDSGLPTIVPIPDNGRTMPSVVTLLQSPPSPHDDVLVGKQAIAVEAEMGSYRNVKRILGRGVTAAQESVDVVPFLLASSTSVKKKKKKKSKYNNKKKKNKKKNDQSLTQQIKEAEENPAVLMTPFVGDSSASTEASTTSTTRIMPAEISAHILRKLIRTVEQATQQTVTRAVIGVPAYFHDAQRDATLHAAKLAGLGDKVKLLREPEAAALAYGVGKQQLSQQTQQEDADQDELVLVFDLGGGTYDVSMLLVGGGLTEIITTSGNSQLGGSDFDAKVAQHLRQVMAGHGFVIRNNNSNNNKTKKNKNKPSDDDEEEEKETSLCLATDAIVRSAEMIRIYLSNNKKVKLALPLDEDSWSHMPHATDVILPLNFELEEDHDNNQNDEEAAVTAAASFTAAGISNSTHVLCELKRNEMEKMCQDEFLALLRPIREVAIMAGALLPGDTSPTLVEAAVEMEEGIQQQQQQQQQQDTMVFENFYQEEEENDNDHGANAVAAAAGQIKEQQHNDDEEVVDDRILAQLQDGLDEMSMKERKKAQQRGRRKARDVTKRERKYRQEKRKLAEQQTSSVVVSDSSAADGSNVKVRDGISGRPISRVVLVGGATRMPAIGRLLAALTGVTPQKTVNPDEAVALGCAVHVGVLDGKEDLGTVLNPMQAAILRAVAEQQQKQGGQLQPLLSDDDDFDEEVDFEEVEFF